MFRLRATESIEKPCCCSQVCTFSISDLGHAKARRKLVRGQPLVIMRRRRILLRAQSVLPGPPAVRRAVEHDAHAFQLGIGAASVRHLLGCASGCCDAFSSDICETFYFASNTGSRRLRGHDGRCQGAGRNPPAYPKHLLTLKELRIS